MMIQSCFGALLNAYKFILLNALGNVYNKAKIFCKQTIRVINFGKQYKTVLASWFSKVQPWTELHWSQVQLMHSFKHLVGS